MFKLNTDFYEGAVIRMATLQKQEGQAGQLLFATVSLLSRGRPLPPPMKGIDKISVGNTGENVYFRRTILSVKEAIDWYRSLGSGDDKSPIPSQVDDRNKRYDGIKIGVSRLVDNPVWPYLGLPIGEDLFSHSSEKRNPAPSNPAPFIGNVSARIHRRFGSQDGFDLILEDNKVIDFIARRLHINLRFYQEYLGSVALVVPDPVLKKIDCFMIPTSADRDERIVYRFVPRAEELLAGLKLITVDKQTNLLTDFSTYDIPDDGILDIDKGECNGMYGYIVLHPEHGVLRYSSPLGFIREISFTMESLTKSIKVNVPTGESSNSPCIEYNTTQSSPLEKIQLGNTVPDINTRVSMATSYRNKLANAKYYGQRWFPNGSREEAMRFIQEELKQAKSKVLIADPYLAGLQLGQFLYAVNPRTTRVILLTSNLAFNSKKSKLSKIKEFSNQLDQMKKEVNVTANVYVLQSPILHDRFLVIDDDVWFLGNSLNTLGKKASLILKLPNPDEITAKLEDMINKTVTFDKYVVEIKSEINKSGEM